MCRAMPCICVVIKSFRSRALRIFFEAGDARRLSVPNAARISRILRALNDSGRPEDMALPGFRFHALKGSDRAVTPWMRAPIGESHLHLTRQMPSMSIWRILTDEFKACQARPAAHASWGIAARGYSSGARPFEDRDCPPSWGFSPELSTIFLTRNSRLRRPWR